MIPEKKCLFILNCKKVCFDDVHKEIEYIILINKQLCLTNNYYNEHT